MQKIYKQAQVQFSKKYKTSIRLIKKIQKLVYTNIKLNYFFYLNTEKNSSSFWDNYFFSCFVKIHISIKHCICCKLSIDFYVIITMLFLKQKLIDNWTRISLYFGNWHSFLCLRLYVNHLQVNWECLNWMSFCSFYVHI